MPASTSEGLASPCRDTGTSGNDESDRRGPRRELLTATTARAQSLSAELDLTAGYSTQENVTAAATQFPRVWRRPAGVRFYGEGAWGKQFNGMTDAFGAAYRIRRRAGHGGVRRTDLQAGRQSGGRSNRSVSDALRDLGPRRPLLSGFLRAPLSGTHGCWALSNNFLEQGVDAIVGIPQLYVEASVGAPGDVGKVSRRSGVDTVVRVQGYRGPLIVGVSYMRSQPYMARTVEQARLGFTGINVRWSLAASRRGANGSRDVLSTARARADGMPTPSCIVQGWVR